MTNPTPQNRAALRRWRLVLGRFSEQRFDMACGQPCLDGTDLRRDAALGALYGRALRVRGIDPGDKDAGADRSGSLDPSLPSAVEWLREAETLFPKRVSETIRAHAIERFGMVELLTDPKTLDDMPPDPALLAVLMQARGRSDDKLNAAIRRIARKVIDDLIARLKPRLSNAVRGQRDRTRRSHHQVAANVNWPRTIRENLGGYDPDTGSLVVERIAFMARKRRALPWTVILCVDQSGSMVESLIHSAVMASILTGLPGVRVKMVLFDTSVVDVTDQLDDPLDLLMTAQLGGGTDIGKAVRFCEDLVEDPTRTVFALVSDFFEGPSPQPLYAAVARLSEARVTLTGIAALGASGEPAFDREIANGLAGRGMDVGAMSPDAFAEWFAARLA